MPEPKPILTLPEAAALLQVTDRTLYNWIHRAGFPAVKVGNTVRIRYDKLMAWMDNQEKNRR